MTNTTKTVYLAGPISGCTFGECVDWRQHAISELAGHGIKGLSPMRAKDYLKSEKIIDGAYEDTVLSCARGIYTRDRFDSLRCDVLLVNFLGATRVSIGTVMEFGWVDSRKTPIICVMESEGNPHDHPMIREAIGFRVTTMQEALNVAIAILK
jgi:nucleoside 2-deoxyribosyltransferase